MNYNVKRDGTQMRCEGVEWTQYQPNMVKSLEYASGEKFIKKNKQLYKYTNINSYGREKCCASIRKGDQYC
jgi:hypothetical protein